MILRFTANPFTHPISERIRWSESDKKYFKNNIFYLSLITKQFICAKIKFVIIPDPKAERYVKHEPETEYQIFSNGFVIAILDEK